MNGSIDMVVRIYGKRPLGHHTVARGVAQECD